ncbi:MAG: SelB C-terminal domain-containing protein, partial [Actinobacteria bacterium]|nr:SelB C-terminal domain-containing protein [Actinomycetota bacterium]
VLAGATVLDPSPPPLSGRGAAAGAGRELASWPDPPDAASLLRRHGLLRAGALAAMGVADQPPPVAGDWLADPQRWAALKARLADAVAAHAAADPLAAGMTLEAARAAVGLPDRRLVPPLAQPPLVITSGLLRHAVAAGPERAAGPGASTGTAAPAPEAAGQGSARPGGAASRTAGDGPPAGTLPDQVAAAVERLLSDLAAAPFAAPEAPRLRELGLGPRAIAAAHRAGLLIRISDQIVLAPGAAAAAAEALAGLPQPFTAAQARQALGTTRRVAIPLLEYLDRAGVTRRLPDDTRVLAGHGDPAGRPGVADR